MGNVISGWANIKTGDFVPDEAAFDYALERCVEMVPAGFRGILWVQEFKEMLVEWFYSGEWIREEETFINYERED